MGLFTFGDITANPTGLPIDPALRLREFIELATLAGVAGLDLFATSASSLGPADEFSIPPRVQPSVIDDEQAIRDLIDRWAAAVHAGDLDTVLADHAQDIVMFDVPPPEQGVRGIEQYRETWPPFFEWQRSGASFDIEELEVTAGEDVAYAWALLRCGTREEFESDPRNRLRLTIGLRKDGGRWIVAHEHHSFPDKT